MAKKQKLTPLEKILQLSKKQDHIEMNLTEKQYEELIPMLNYLVRKELDKKWQ